MRAVLYTLAALAFLLTTNTASAQQQPHNGNPVPYAADEPMAEAYSLASTGRYLDTVARFWMNDSCGSCHANYGYLIARPLVGEASGAALAETRRFLEKRIAVSKQEMKHPGSAGIHFKSEAVGVAVALAFHDAQTVGKLRQTTREALEQMWEVQFKSGPREGSWACGCGEFPAVELDRYYSAALAAIAAGVAPENYAQSPAARDGLTRLRRFLTRTAPPHLHHRAMLMWASFHLDGLMTDAERRTTIDLLLAKQRTDGGWSMGEISDDRGIRWESDGYGTAFVIFILRQAGLSADRRELVRGIRWLHSNQRASGNWFTFSQHAGHRPEGGHGTRELSVLNATAAFAVLALRGCEEADRSVPALLRNPTQRLHGLAIRGSLRD